MTCRKGGTNDDLDLTAQRQRIESHIGNFFEGMIEYGYNLVTTFITDIYGSSG